VKAAERFFAEVIAEYGITEGDIVRIPMTQCELARRRKRAASTVGAYLSAMGPRVVRRSPEIVLARQDNQPALDLERAPAAASSDSELLAAYRDLAIAQARVIELQAEFAEPARGPREMPRELREVARSSEQEEELLASSASQPRERPRAEPANPANRWTDAELDGVLAPLQQAAERAELQRMNNRTQLAHVLHPYPLARIEAAVTELVRQVNQRDTRMRSPFGMLHRWAVDGDLPAAQNPTTASLRAAEPIHQQLTVDDAVRAAVAALSADELADLDALVDSGYGSKGAMPSAMRRAARLEQYPYWVASRTPQAHHEVTPGTPRGHLGDNPSTPREQHQNTTSTTGAHR
jgi:hypothetical protein